MRHSRNPKVLLLILIIIRVGTTTITTQALTQQVFLNEMNSGTDKEISLPGINANGERMRERERSMTPVIQGGDTTWTHTCTWTVCF